MKLFQLVLIATSLCLGGFAHADDEAAATPAPTEMATPKPAPKMIETKTVGSEDTPEGRKRFMKTMEAEVRDFEKQIDELKYQARNASAGARAKLDHQVQLVDAKRAAAKEQLDHMKDASGKAWDDMKVGLNKAMTELKSSFDKARVEFNLEKKNNPPIKNNHQLDNEKEIDPD